MLNKRSRKRPYTVRFHLYKTSRIARSTETEGKLPVAGDWGTGGVWGVLLMGMGFLGGGGQ